MNEKLLMLARELLALVFYITTFAGLAISANLPVQLKDGEIVKGQKNPQLYQFKGGVLYPVNNAPMEIIGKLKVFSDETIQAYPKGPEVRLGLTGELQKPLKFPEERIDFPETNFSVVRPPADWKDDPHPGRVATWRHAARGSSISILTEPACMQSYRAYAEQMFRSAGTIIDQRHARVNGRDFYKVASASQGLRGGVKFVAYYLKKEEFFYAFFLVTSATFLDETSLVLDGVVGSFTPIRVQEPGLVPLSRKAGTTEVRVVHHQQGFSIGNLPMGWKKEKESAGSITLESESAKSLVLIEADELSKSKDRVGRWTLLSLMHISRHKLSRGVAAFTLKEAKRVTVRGKKLCQVSGETGGEGKIYGTLTALLTTMNNVDYTFSLLTAPEFYDQSKLLLEQMALNLSFE